MTHAGRGAGVQRAHRTRRGLPADWYYDAAHYRARARADLVPQLDLRRPLELSLRAPRSFLTFEIGDQNLLLVRDDGGEVRAFHNTCRHRGAALCLDSRGALRGGKIVCPYHAWTYSLQGELLRTSSKTLPSGFEKRDFPLYRVRAVEWSGFLFVAIAEPARRSRAASICRSTAWRLGDWRTSSSATC